MRTRALVAAAALAAAVSALAVRGSATPPDAYLSNVPTANTKAVGYAPGSKLSAELRQIVQAQGSTQLENSTALIRFYGYENDVVSADDPTKPQMVPTVGVANEAQKTEPDKNTYLVFKKSLAGADSNYYYGTQFLYQGHENAASVNGSKQGYITRINLDADAAHRVTLLATHDDHGQPLATIDGSTWDPWARKLLFTTESASAPTYAATPDYPSTVADVSGALGRGGYEGIQNDSAGNLIIVEDIGGSNKAGSVKAKAPNSFVYRFVPDTPDDLANGKLEVLQVLNEAGQPITFASESTFPSADQAALHAYGKVFDTRWVTIHDTAVDGHAPFNANVWAKGLQTTPAQPPAKQGTPFKRPENGQFRPGSDFRQFYFDETGDTDATSSENGDPVTGVGGVGGWGGIFKLSQRKPAAESGRLTLFYKGNKSVTGLDNVSFLSKNLITFVEDAGDTLHGQRNALDSGFVWDVTADYSDPAKQPLRWLAEGRDASATLDSSYSFSKNDGDNEITGTAVSNGDPGPEGILGARIPHLFKDGWRWFYTQQHGDNTTYEVVPSRSKGEDDSD